MKSIISTIKTYAIEVLLLLNLSAGIIGLITLPFYAFLFFGNSFIIFDYLYKGRKGWFKSKGIFKRHEKVKIE